MSEINMFWACAGCFVGYLLGGIAFCLHASRHGWRVNKHGWFKEEKPIVRDQKGTLHFSPSDVQDVNLHPLGVTAPNDFAVAGKPLKPSWRLRKRELEAASRTKRKQLESFREIA